MTGFFAHSGNDALKSDWQTLRIHLEAVAEGARKLAMEAFPGDVNLADAAYAAGLLHDLGKYRPEFQLRLQGKHPANERTWHKQAGAAVANQSRRWDLAFAIAGHHGGLPDHADLKDLVAGPSGQALVPQIWPTALADCPKLSCKIPALPKDKDRWWLDWTTRCLFSCLVDADWQDTSAHQCKVYGWEAEGAPKPLDAENRLQRVLEYIGQRAASCKDARIAAVRGDILSASLNAASLSPGLFSMTVPTGGGKTLAGLAFALAHARQHGLRRVIYVAPYLSILEQNGREIRRALQVDPEDSGVQTPQPSRQAATLRKPSRRAACAGPRRGNRQ